MLLATVYALTAAVLHAGWNLFAKRSGDPFIALWGQFLIAGAAGAVLLLVFGGVPAGAWTFAAISGAVHIAYVVALGWAYEHGDFSLAYPLARGGGALLLSKIAVFVTPGSRMTTRMPNEASSCARPSEMPSRAHFDDT